MRGILNAAGYVPYWRLQRSAIHEFTGSGGGKGTRSVASFDEDTTTMAVEACRNLGGAVRPDALWFATAEPAYLDKSNAATVHAALRLDPEVPALDMGGAIRSGVGALRAALEATGTILVASSDIRTGQPSGPDESNTGDAAAAAVIGEGDVIASYLGGASVVSEFVERWRTPGERRSKVWEDRFGESVYVPLGEQAYTAALKSASLEPGDVDVVCVAGMHSRSVTRLRKALGSQADDLSSTVGASGTAHAMMLLAHALEQTEAGKVVALLALADGADVLLFRTVERPESKRKIAAQVAAATDVPYARFLSWRGMLSPEPPNRPEPARVSSPAAERAEAWKFGLVDEAASLAGEAGTIATFTVDRLAYSPSPPVVFAVVDFEGGRRLPLELTDVDPGELEVGSRVEMTFRRLSTADGIHNYFWKGKPLLQDAPSGAPSGKSEAMRRQAPPG